MKKLFSLFAAVLFAGSMFAVNFQLIKSTDDLVVDEYYVIGSADATSAVYMSTAENTNNRKVTEAIDIEDGVITATDEVLVLQLKGETGKWKFLTTNYKGTDGYLSNANSGNNNNCLVGTTEREFTISFEGNSAVITATSGSARKLLRYNSSSSCFACYGSGQNPVYLFRKSATQSNKPIISASNVDFGTVAIEPEDDAFVKDVDLVVTGANLSEAIVATGSEHVTVSGNLNAEGGTLNLHIVAAPGEFSEKITLTSGETVKEVTVSGKVVKKVVAPGEPATMAGGTNGSDAKVNEMTAIKVGKNGENGDMTITVPAYANKLHFFAAAWNNTAGTISLSAPEGVTLDQEEVSLVADAGISGNSPFTLANPISNDHLFTIALTGVTEDVAIKLASGTAQRFVVWGATYELGEEPEAKKYCELPSGHLQDANFGDVNGRILLTINKVKGTNNIRVAVKNNAENGNTKEGLNFLWVIADGKEKVVYGSGTHADADVEEVSVVINYDAAQDSYTFNNIHWAYSGWDGEWAIDGLTVLASELCDDESITTAIDNTALEAKTVKAIRNGQVVIIRDGKVLNMLGVELR